MHFTLDSLMCDPEASDNSKQRHDPAQLNTTTGILGTTNMKCNAQGKKAQIPWLW